MVGEKTRRTIQRPSPARPESRTSGDHPFQREPHPATYPAFLLWKSAKGKPKAVTNDVPQSSTTAGTRPNWSEQEKGDIGNFVNTSRIIDNRNDP